MPPNRLYVDEILSIGLVSSADNPESTVEIFKARGIAETGEEWSRRINEQWAANDRRLDALKKKLDARQRQSAKERREKKMKNSSETIGELVTEAIDAKARSWHLDGVHVEVPLVKLRTRIRETMPALKALERSQEPVAVAKSRVLKAADRELSAAWDFVTEWS